MNKQDYIIGQSRYDFMIEGMKSHYTCALQELVEVLTRNNILVVVVLANLDSRCPCVCISPQNPYLRINWKFGKYPNVEAVTGSCQKWISGKIHLEDPPISPKLFPFLKICPHVYSIWDILHKTHVLDLPTSSSSVQKCHGKTASRNKLL
jgi:hypothetical protein